MSYYFHDIKKTTESYLDDLMAKSRKSMDHPKHLRDVFDRCRHYRICLNPHKCIFYVKSGRLLVFIVSKDGIMVDLFKIKAIV